jgi:hypothetical protein
MAQEQDVFISGISGSIAQWSTEATAGRISATLSKIAGQNSQLINLLNHVAAGTKMSTKEMNEMGNEVRSSNKAAQAGQKTERIEAAKQGQFWKGLMSKVGMGDDRIVQQLIVNHRATVNASKQIESLVKSGFTRPEATSLVEESNGFRGGKDSGEFVKSIRKNFTKIGASIYALVTGIEEATKTGFMERFDMASELRQSGLTAGFTDINQGFIQLSKIISETGFTFGEAAEFTKNFSKTVGVNGVQSTLKFVKSMAHTGDAGGLMNKFSLHFGQVINMSGQYLEGLRISGQLQGRSEQQLRKGMDSFMSNVQATSNVLKVSMEEAAEIMKNSLGEADRGRLLTLPQEMQDSIRAGLQFAGAGEGPIMDLLAARLGAGSDQGFMLTSEFKQMSGSMIGQELIKYVQQVAPTLENQGDQAFQSQLANTLPQEVQRIIEMMGQQGTRGLILADDGMATILAQINQMAQNMKDAAKGISGGGTEDRAAMLWTEQQRQATVQAERAMTRLMPAFEKNIEDLTTVNREFANQAAETLKFNKSFISSATNTIVLADIAFKNLAIGTLETQGMTWRDLITQLFTGENIKNPLFDGSDTSFTGMLTQDSIVNPPQSLEHTLKQFKDLDINALKTKLEELKEEQKDDSGYLKALAGNTSLLPVMIPALMTLLAIPGGDKILGLNQGFRDTAADKNNQAKVIAKLEELIRTIEGQ